MRVHDSDGRRVVGEAVVALGKKGNGIDMAIQQGLLEFFFLESRSDAFDKGRGVKIQMDLTKAEMMHGESKQGGIKRGRRRRISNSVKIAKRTWRLKQFAHGSAFW